MNDMSDVHLPVELGPGPNAYMMISLVVGLPAVIWFVGILFDKKMPIQLLEYCMAGAAFIVLYIKNLNIRLDEVGISQGFSVLRTFMPYETVSGVHREVRTGRGGPTTVLVVTKRDSRKRIVIPLRSFDQTKLAHVMALLARKAPQAHIEDALYIQFKP
jgi:hypothetical protein